MREGKGGEGSEEVKVVDVCDAVCYSIFSLPIHKAIWTLRSPYSKFVLSKI